MHLRGSVDAGEKPAEEEPPENCAASAEWLPNTPPLDLFNPLPHPASECAFYRGGWQNFLIATEADANGETAIRAYPTIDDIFESKTPHAVRNTQGRAWLGDIKQAGGRQILIDQNGHAICYGIHVNHAFAEFVNKHGLRTLEGVQQADPNLFLPAGLVEFKSAWQDIDPADGRTQPRTETTSRQPLGCRRFIAIRQRS